MISLYRFIPKRFDLDTALKTGIILLLFFTALILGLNLYAFYSVFLSSSASSDLLISPPEKNASAADDLEEIVRMLDERQKRFNEILEAE